MNGILPTGWQGRLLALTLLFATFAAAYFLLVAPWYYLYSVREARIARERTLLVKLNAVADELPRLHASAAKLRSAVDSDKLTFEGASDSIASAALQMRVEQSAGAAGVTVGSSEIIPARARGSYHRIGLRLLLSGSYENLIRLLVRLEAATPSLVIDDLQIRGLQRRLGIGGALPLDVSLEVSGFRETKIDAAKP